MEVDGWCFVKLTSCHTFLAGKPPIERRSSARPKTWALPLVDLDPRLVEPIPKRWKWLYSSFSSLTVSTEPESVETSHGGHAVSFP